VYTITKEFTFEASHVLLDMPEGHKCGRMHGHSYKVVVELMSEELDEYGFVVDYGELDALKKMIDARFDHRHLNDVLEMRQPTAEKIAETIWQWCQIEAWGPLVSAVRVSETAKTWAIYRPNRYIGIPLMTEEEAAAFENSLKTELGRQGIRLATVSHTEFATRLQHERGHSSQ
jgi:6-pyruvoyltetrahydropterin/6-carboxytetrahydropterin synthase